MSINPMLKIHIQKYLFLNKVKKKKQFSFSVPIISVHFTTTIK